jgi:hypothetical protein
MLMELNATEIMIIKLMRTEQEIKPKNSKKPLTRKRLAEIKEAMELSINRIGVKKI